MIRGNFISQNGVALFVPDLSGNFMVCFAPFVGVYHSGLDLNY